MKGFLSLIGTLYLVIAVYFTFHFHSTQYYGWSYCAGEALVWPAHVWPALGRLIHDVVGGILLILFLIFLFFFR